MIKKIKAKARKTTKRLDYECGGKKVKVEKEKEHKDETISNKYLVAAWVPAQHEWLWPRLWVNGAEGEELGGSTAKSGADLLTDARDDLRLPAVFANPLKLCPSSSSKLSGSNALSPRGDCDFMTKAEVVQSGGVAELLVIHDKEDLLEMSCHEKNIVNIKIPVVMIAKSRGEAINKSMTGGREGELMLYSPNHPIVDFSVLFLWLMAVGTVISASLWLEITSRIC
ncbi:Signal peptide peptidase-like 3 [Camellia lanceoleosa]|uniref:Signal peptide peptidase-like 3 n=1 Tax=Camellia lanceoleosa TaxID=1840588 RepID=A0ACC0GR80_9ERIC|nr:Signal peptide peptidase-like 3 [Camellia lanceoleosa]